MVPGLMPAAMDGGGWTWRTTKEPPSSGDRAVTLSRAHRKAVMLSSLPSTATTTHFRFAAIADDYEEEEQEQIKIQLEEVVLISADIFFSPFWGWI